jgi:hypothetical protein
MGKRKQLQIINPKYINRLLSKGTDRKPMTDEQTLARSRLRAIPSETIMALYNIYEDYTLTDCNEKANLIAQVMEPLGFVEIGCGTNRVVFRKHNYIYKVALDRRGRQDNINEYQICVEMPQIFYKVYEIGGLKDVGGLMLVGEYAELISEAYFIEHKNQIKKILELASHSFIMDDVGLTTKNFCNWGLRYNPDGTESLIIIDNAYFYPIKNAQTITCQCGGKIVPSSDYTYYVCKNSACAMHYSVPELLNMSGYDYSGFNDEAIKMLNPDGSSSFVKISGNNSNSYSTIDETEAEELFDSYQPATTFDASSANIVEDIEDYWNSNTDNDGNDDGEHVIPYNSIKL